jgi:hypothetical protein
MRDNLKNGNVTYRREHIWTEVSTEKEMVTAKTIENDMNINVVGSSHDHQLVGASGGH